MNGSVFKDRLEALGRQHLARKMRTVASPVAPVVKTSEGDKVNFSTNDYLGLANDQRIKAAAIEALEHWGTGTGSSRLVSGNTEAHNALERALADFMSTQKAVVFPSGYQANVGALVSLTQPGDALFSDALVHASIVDGTRLSRADTHIYRHRDVAHLEELLASNTAPLKMVVTDAVFSMDGDEAPLADIARVAKEHDAIVYVDEAHALGITGSGGRGLSDRLGLVDDVAIRIGTFGKAFGTSGAFVATSEDADGLIRSRARSLLYTTASPASMIVATIAALEIVERAEEERKRLGENVTLFKALATAANLPILDSSSPIQPVLVGSASRVMEASAGLWESGLFVQGMRPPTVPEGTSRLRVTLTAAHTKAQIEKLISALTAVLTQTKTK